MHNFITIESVAIACNTIQWVDERNNDEEQNAHTKVLETPHQSLRKAKKKLTITVVTDLYKFGGEDDLKNMTNFTKDQLDHICKIAGSTLSSKLGRKGC